MTIQLFNFHGSEYEVRFVGTADRPEWVAADVCEVLEIQNTADALAKGLDGDEKGVATIYTPGGDQQMLTVTEAGLYRLVFKSRKPQAKAFQRWVMHEVLPCIRQHGQYPAPAPQPAQAELTGQAKVEWTIKIANDTQAILTKLGFLDERTAIGLADMVKSAVLADQLALPAAGQDARMMIPVSDRVQMIYGLRLSNGMLSAIGRVMAVQYRALHDDAEPPTREQHVDGATRLVKCYTPQDWDDFGDSVLHNYLMKKGLISG